MHHPSPGAQALTDFATRRYIALSDLTPRAKPACPTCAGKGWHTSRSAVPFIGGLAAVACHCTGGNGNG